MHKVKLAFADVSHLDLAQAMEKLPAFRREKAERLQNPQARLLSVGAWRLFQRLLEEQGLAGADQFVRVADSGKPYLENQPALCFNLSHGGNMVACALSSGEVGCDIEPIEKDRPEVSRRFFTPEEQAWLVSREDRADAFTRLWVRKESAVKADGRGLDLSLTSFSVTPEASVLTLEGKTYHQADWRLPEGYWLGVTGTLPMEDVTPEMIVLE